MMTFWILTFLMIFMGTFTSYLSFRIPKNNKLYNKLAFIFILLFISISSLIIYYKTGSSKLLSIKNILQNSNSSSSTIEQSLKNWLALDPVNEQALFLLGNYYMNQETPEKSTQYFATLYKLTKQPQIIAQYAQSLFLSEKSMTEKVYNLLKETLELDEFNTTALGLEGIYFFEKNKYHQAISSWEKALSLEKNKVSIDSLRIGIKKAREILEETHKKKI